MCLLDLKGRSDPVQNGMQYIDTWLTLAVAVIPAFVLFVRFGGKQRGINFAVDGVPHFWPYVG